MPPRLFIAYLVRGLCIWGFVRVFALVGTAALQAVIPEASPGTWPPLAVTALICILDFLRRRERTLVGNLGLSPVAVIVVSILPAFVGEAVWLGFNGP